MFGSDDSFPFEEWSPFRVDIPDPFSGQGFCSDSPNLRCLKRDERWVPLVAVGRQLVCFEAHHFLKNEAFWNNPMNGGLEDDVSCSNWVIFWFHFNGLQLGGVGRRSFPWKFLWSVSAIANWIGGRLVDKPDVFRDTSLQKFQKWNRKKKKKRKKTTFPLEKERHLSKKAPKCLASSR